MSIKRDRSLIKIVLERDSRICCCCKFKASHVHHIIPLYSGGADTIDNMISMCEIDHYHAPDTKEEFEIYVKNNGVKLDLIMGRAINYYLKNKEYMKELDFQDVINITHSLINTMREASNVWNEEKIFEAKKSCHP